MRRSASISVRKLIDLIRKLWSIQILRFFVVGGVNTAFGYGVFALLILLNRQLRLLSPDVELIVVTLVAQVCGILFNFKTTGTIVFKSKDNRLLLRFFGVYLITYLLNYGLLRLLEESWGIDRLVGGAIILLPIALLGYCLNKRFVFNTVDKTGKPFAQPAHREDSHPSG